jgi:hypothetical protein
MIFSVIVTGFRRRENVRQGAKKGRGATRFSAANRNEKNLFCSTGRGFEARAMFTFYSFGPKNTFKSLLLRFHTFEPS